MVLMKPIVVVVEIQSSVLKDIVLKEHTLMAMVAMTVTTA